VSASQKATAQLHIRILPPEEKQELQAEARRHQVSMSALVKDQRDGGP
jgi:plasmid stability protein